LAIQFSRPLVLITGGAGFIGSHTSDELIRQGYRVRILDCLDHQIHGPTGTFPSYLNPEIECIQGDVRRTEDVQQALEGVSIVYHFAALTGVGQSMYDLKNYIDVNVTGTANLIEVITKQKFPIKKFILSSSRAVYGEGTHECSKCGIVYPPIRNRTDMEQNHFEVFCPNCGEETISVATSEDRPLLPISVYGWTKKSQEEICQYAATTFELPVVILRYFNVYGSRQSLINPYTGIISIFFNRLMTSQPISIYENGIPRRDFIHVSDVVQANLKALSKELPKGTILNIGTGIELSIVDVANALTRVLDLTPCLENHGEFRVGDIQACVADITRARKLVGFIPEYSLEQGLSEFVEWAKTQPNNDSYEKAVEELRTNGLFSNSRPGIDK
jgi:dTDP-L-rhamnose 4-epimerase